MYTAIEIATKSDRPDRVALSGINDLQRINSILLADYKEGFITENNKFSNFFQSPDEKFCYTLCSYKNNEIIRYESGIGYYLDGFVYRYRPLRCGRNFSHKIECSNKLHYNFIGDTVIYASMPRYLSDMFFSDNNLIFSKTEDCPVSIQIKPNSLIGRFDNTITDIDLTSPEFSNILAKCLSQYSKQLSLKTSKLDTKLVSTSTLQLKPSVNDNAKKGTFIYDETTDSVKFYNGNKWRTLKWEEDENQE